MSGLVVSTEKLRVERVASGFAHEVAVRCEHEAPPSAEQLVGVTVDVANASWEVFDGSALACATLSIWAYCVVDGGVRAITWTENIRVLVEVASVRTGMRIEGCLRVEEVHPELSRADCRITVCAGISVRGLVLEAVVLEVVTGVELARGEGTGEPGAERGAERGAEPGGEQADERDDERGAKKGAEKVRERAMGLHERLLDALARRLGLGRRRAGRIRTSRAPDGARSSSGR